jgi:hypothetical protein
MSCATHRSIATFHHHHGNRSMTTTTLGALDARLTGDAPRLDPRALGALGMLGSPLMLVEGLRYGFGQSRMDLWTSLGGVVYMLGVLACVVALRRDRASGDGRFATVLHRFQLVVIVAAACWSAAFVVTGPEGGHRWPWLWHAGDAAWPLTHLSMLALGIRILATGRLTGWRRFGAVAAGLALPSFFALAASPVPRPVAAASFGVLTSVGLFTLGWAVFRGGPRAEG